MADFPYEREVDAEHQRRKARPAPGDQRVALGTAQALGAKIVAAIAPVCERVEIAGSIRRGDECVKDVEILAVPELARDLFGEADPGARSALDLCIGDLISSGRLALRTTTAGLVRNGLRYKALVAVETGIAVDLFCVRPPASFGTLLAIRTGPAEYSKALVTKLRERGLRCEGGRVLRDDDGAEVPTPEERDFFEACGVPYVEPRERR